MAVGFGSGERNFEEVWVWCRWRAERGGQGGYIRARRMSKTTSSQWERVVRVSDFQVGRCRLAEKGEDRTIKNDVLRLSHGKLKDATFSVF